MEETPFNRLRRHGGVVVGYLLACVVLTYPLIDAFFSHVPGCCDVWQNVWNLWWVHEAVAEGGNVYWTSMQFHPTGIGLALHTLSLANTLPGVLLQEVIGLVATYNVLVLLSFVLAGYGAFLLAGRVVDDWRAAWLAGFLYAFAPYHFAELGVGHINLASIQWIPFYAFFLGRMRNDPTMRNAVGAAVFLWLSALAEWQYLGFLCLYTAAYLCYWGWRRPESIASRVFLTHFAVFGCAGALLVGPFMYPVLRAALGGGEGGYSEGIWMGTSTAYAASYGAYLLPSHLHPIWGKAVGALPLSGGRVPLGWVAVGLAAYGLAGDARLMGWLRSHLSRARRLLWRQQAIVPVGFTLGAVATVSYVLFGANVWGAAAMLGLSSALIVGYYMLKEKVIGFWPTITIVFGILSLGPLLPLPSGDYYPLPYVIFYYLPLFNAFRAPYRFAVIVVLGVAVLAARGADRLLSNNPLKKRQVFGFLVCLAVFESLAIPLPVSDARPPAIYPVLADAPAGVLLPVPVPPHVYHLDDDTTIVYGIPQTLYYQTVHEKPIVGGYISRITETPDYAMAPLEGTPLLFHLRHPFEEDIVDQDIGAVGRTVLRDLGVRYVVVDASLYGPGGYPEGSAAYAVNLISDVLRHEPDDVRDGRAYYAVEESTEDPVTYVAFGEGWSRLNDAGTDRFRRLEDEKATVFIRHAESGEGILQVTAATANESARLKVYDEKKVVGRFTLNNTPTTYFMPVGAGDDPVERILTFAREPATDIRFYRIGFSSNA